MKCAALKLIGILLAAAALTGCLVARDYVGPTSTNTAFVSMTSSGGELNPVIYEKAENCESRNFIRTNQFNNAVATRDEGLLSFAKIDAGHPLSIGAYLTLPDSVVTDVNFCVPILNFTPQAGRYYKIVLSGGKDGCHGALLSTDNPASTGFKREGFRKMIFSNGLGGEESSFCKAGEYVAN